ncbi:MAG: 4-hydroxybenzoate octaprenyltransferase [Gammaproteobacteria bacterium]|nr:4-hydroxybenzoate octaprenyltransferase [Gammaproteobacteria bacterium]MCY4219368.1 4-hydroxybenzoate octaprenyltransferase [Gammaproteobacteria bacterium]
MTTPILKEISLYIRLIRLDRPIGSLLLLWPTLWALWLAGEGQPDPTVVLIMLVGTLVMRSAGCIINDFADRKIDGHITRTRNRPLASGDLSVAKAMTLFAILILLAAWLVTQLNMLSVVVSLFALVVAVIYPFTKRFTHLPQFVLGIAFSMGIPIAYTALTNSLPLECWILFAANYCWIVAYDTYYAMADRDDDIQIGVKSTAILFDTADRSIILILQLITLGILTYIGISQNVNWHFFIAIAISLGIVTYQQILTRERIPANCFKAFLNNNWFGAVIQFGFMLGLIEQS